MRPYFSFSNRCLYTLVVMLLNLNNSFAIEPEKENSGWSFYFDNDLFSLADRDNDYTGGIALKLAGTRVKTSLFSVDGLLDWTDRFSGFPQLYNDEIFFTAHSMEMGFTLFTPMDLDRSAPLFDQHPYASLFFISNTRLAIVPEKFLTYQSSFTVGFLGLRLGGEVQKTLHKIFVAETPRGWRHQISAGGEPTFKYSVSRSRSHVFKFSRQHQLELKTSSEANIGYSTDIGVSLSLRWGSIDTPWWSFNPHNAEYISLGSPAIASSQNKQKESYLWLGAGVKYRFYNALLQGQFRDSAVTFDRDQLVPIITEAWLGYTHEFEEKWQLSGFIRARNKEIDLSNVQAPIWGGLIISRSF